MNSAVVSMKVSKAFSIDEWKVCATAAAIWVSTSAALAYGAGFARVWTTNQPSFQAAIALSDRQDLCGLFLYKQPTTGYVFIHRNVPIYMSFYNRLNLEAEEGPVVEPDWALFNYVIASRRFVPGFTPRFQLQTCFGSGGGSDPCILHSPNACASSTQMVPLLSERHFGTRPGDIYNLGRQ